MHRICCVIVGILLAGCTQVKQIQHLDPLLTLKGYADEKEAQELWVNQEAARFETIRDAAKGQSIGLTTQAEILTAYGEPVLKETIMDQGRALDRWLYRHPIQKLAQDRVYLYFESSGKLIRYEYVLPQTSNPA